MANEKKKNITLNDLGVEDTETPAEVAAKENTITTDDGNKVETISSDTVDKNEVEKMMNELKEKEKEGKVARKIIVPGHRADEIKKEESNKKPSVIHTPNTDDGVTQYQEVDINKIFKNKKPAKKEAIRETLDKMYNFADEGIEREKKELLAPNGRITEAKYKYIEEHYAILEKRASKNESLKKKMKAVEELIDTDPRFDNISPHERKGYILFVVARDEKTGVNNEYFGIEDPKKSKDGYVPNPRLSSEANKEIESLVMRDDEDFTDFFSDENEVNLGNNKGTSPIVPDLSKARVEDQVSDAENADLLLAEESDDNAYEDDELDTIPEETSKRILKEYKNEVVDKLNLDINDNISNFTIETKPIKLTAALSDKKVTSYSILWPLQYSGILVEMTPFSGDEIVLLSPSQTKFDTVAGLRTVFSTIYHHIINPNKPKFEIWLRQISDYDIDGLLFAVYVANFKDTNYITYECQNKKCRKVFLLKKDIMDMVNFPNEKVKERFESILRKDTVMSSMYKSSPRLISKDYAIGFTSQSIYSSLFEPAALSKEFSEKYSSIIDIMPNIDKVYKVNYTTKSLTPISFGVDETSLAKTVMRKVKALDTIFKTFTPDERSIAIGEARKVSRSFDEDKITYSIPETTCSNCKEEIKRVEANPLNLLFTRSQLAVIASSIQE